MKCKHQFHFVRIYYKPFNDKERYATFICDCGLVKEVKFKIEDKE